MFSSFFKWNLKLFLGLLYRTRKKSEQCCILAHVGIEKIQFDIRLGAIKKTKNFKQ